MLPILWSLGSLWLAHKAKNKLTAALFLKIAEKKHTVLFNDVFQLVGYLHSIENNEFVEAVDFSKKYYLNCVASIGFGLNIDCFGEKKSTFEEKAK